MFYGSGILIWRIWSASKKGENSPAAKQLQFIVRILMESGVLYLTISLAHFLAWFGHDDFAIHILGSIVSFRRVHIAKRNWSLTDQCNFGFCGELYICRIRS